MKIRIKTAHGYISFQPLERQGSSIVPPLQYRQQAGEWEEIDLEGFEQIVKGPSPTPDNPSIDPIIEICGNRQGQDLVECVFSQLQPRGNPDLVLKMTSYVAWILRHEGAGLLRRAPGGANNGDYHGTLVSISRIFFKDGSLVKIMTDVPNGDASWQDNGTQDLNNWVAPVQPS